MFDSYQEFLDVWQPWKSWGQDCQSEERNRVEYLVPGCRGYHGGDGLPEYGEGHILDHEVFGEVTVLGGSQTSATTFYAKDRHGEERTIEKGVRCKLVGVVTPAGEVRIGDYVEFDGSALRRVLDIGRRDGMNYIMYQMPSTNAWIRASLEDVKDFKASKAKAPPSGDLWYVSVNNILAGIGGAASAKWLYERQAAKVMNFGFGFLQGGIYSSTRMAKEAAALPVKRGADITENLVVRPEKLAWDLINAETGMFSEARKVAAFAVCAQLKELGRSTLSTEQVLMLFSALTTYESLRGVYAKPVKDADKPLILACYHIASGPAVALIAAEAVRAYEHVRRTSR